jgi:hypothetical protein
LEGLGLYNVGIFNGHSDYLTTIWYVSWPFCTCCGNLVLFPRFGILYQEKSGNPATYDNKTRFCGRRSFPVLWRNNLVRATRSQSYYFNLQRQRCKNLQRN